MKHLLLTTIAAVVLVGCGESIHEAAEDGNIEAVKQHIAAGTDVNAKDKYGESPLLFAATFGHKEIAELLIAEGADVNTKIDKTGMTPLHYAAFKGHREIAELLIANGADVNAKRGDFTTPLHFSTGGGHKEVAELLIAEGADVNAKDNIEWTPLHRAVLEGQKDVVELLIAAGADVNAKSDEGKTPLDWVDFSGPLTADLLRKHGGKTKKELEAEGK